MAKRKAPNIVAELGRPETPAETAARKSETSRLYRSRKTVNNLVFSLLVTVGLVFVIYLMVPRGTGDFADRSVDVAQIARDAGSSHTLAVPAVPDTWKAKQARLTNSNGVIYWQVNYTTENDAYAAVVQAHSSDGSALSEEWIATKLEQQRATGVEEIAGASWTVYDQQQRRADQVNMRFGLETQFGTDTVLVYGTDDASVIRVLAAQVSESLTSAAGLGGDPTSAPKGTA